MPITDVPKTGERNRGRPAGPVKIPGVEEFQCPKGKGKNHELVNVYGGSATKCRYCHETWAELDAKVRRVANREAAKKAKELAERKMREHRSEQDAEGELRGQNAS